MKILVLTIHYWPEKTGIGAVLTRRCEVLASAGHEVTVCTAMPFYPQWRTQKPYRGKFAFSEKQEGVNIRRSWIWVPKKMSSAKRVLLEASFLATSLVRAFTSRRPDVLLFVSPPLGLGFLATLLSRWWKLPYVFDVQDLQPDTAADLGMMPKPLLPVLFKLEAMAYRNATLISTVTDGMREKIIAKGVAASKVVVVPPPADKSLFDVGAEADAQLFRKKHNLENKFVVAHSGNMGVKQGLDLVLDAACHLREREDIVFLLAGDGVMRKPLQARAELLKLDNLRFLPVQQKSSFFEMLAAIDLALIVQQSAVTDIVFPSKTVTLMAAGCPVLASVNSNSQIARVMRQSQGGLVTEPEAVLPLVAKILQLLGDPEKRLAMGKCGRRYARQHWDETTILANVEEHLVSACNPRPPKPREVQVGA